MQAAEKNWQGIVSKLVQAFQEHKLRGLAQTVRVFLLEMDPDDYRKWDIESRLPLARKAADNLREQISAGRPHTFSQDMSKELSQMPCLRSKIRGAVDVEPGLFAVRMFGGFERIEKDTISLARPAELLFSLYRLGQNEKVRKAFVAFLLNKEPGLFPGISVSSGCVDAGSPGLSSGVVCARQ